MTVLVTGLVTVESRGGGISAAKRACRPHPSYDPIPRSTKPYLDRDLKIAPVHQTVLDNKPKPSKNLRQQNCDVDHDSVVHQLNPSNEQRHRQCAYYLANVTMIDEKVGEIMDAIESPSYLENSVIIFTSDHGDRLTDHGHSQKWTMYDQITRLPIIIWAPDRSPGDRRIKGLCQTMDLGPTILQLAAVEVPQAVAAKSLLPVLKNETSSESCLRNIVFAEQAGDNNLSDTDFVTMVRTQEWKPVHFLEEPWGQLFDLVADPAEDVNLRDIPKYVEKNMNH